MSERERTGRRDLTYSAWHRSQNLAEYLDPVFKHIVDHRERRRQAYMAATSCSMIDVDGLEYCKQCRAPLALIELKHMAATEKTTAVLEALGELALVPVFLVEYSTDNGDLAGFRVTRRYPRGGHNREPMSLHQYAEFVLGIHRTPHSCTSEIRSA